MVIKAVIFDIDGVLVDSFDANLKFIQNIFKKAGRKPITKTQYKKDGFHRPLKDVIRIFGQCKNEKDVEDIFLLTRKVKYPKDLYKFPPHLQDTIKIISRSYKLAVVTSRSKIGTEEVLRYSETGKYFPIVVHYGQYKNPKPHPEPLWLAAKRLKIKPSEIVYIGDSLTDIQAAKAAGMKIILFSRKIINGVDEKTTKFVELPRLIARLNSDRK
ncbi:TPA: HAD-IIIA family hydrolase [Candidatus Micrarchaeota archaeon]|jgi:pyrophosphatase PpaX|nr:HAD-IIIA family hydrolase [Candidatus Micrarchaeota archaeon]HII09741.1 HAD-IIIA family hydrolase [Candidatus Micrarchaeota archaeon]